MSVIGVRGIPPKCTLMNVVKLLAKTINGHFEALNFKMSSGKGLKVKTCYLRLSEKLDPVRVVEKINTGSYPKYFRPYAFIPDSVPDLPLATKTKKIPAKIARSLRLPGEPQQILTIANEELLTELQLKYPGLYNLNKKLQMQSKDAGRSLILELAKKINERLKVIADSNEDAMKTCFKLTQWYRRTHPHFGDFQLVLSTLHALEDASGSPRTQIQEKDLAALPPNPHIIDNLPLAKVQEVCGKYSDRIIKKISEHVSNLKSEVSENDTEDEIVRKKVREELKKMAPFLPLIVKQVVSKHFIPEKNQFDRIRIYGEPFLPSKETMSPFVRRYHPGKVMRSERIYNLLLFSVPPTHFSSLMAMDGTVLNGAKLVIRSSDMPICRIAAESIMNAGGDTGEPHELENVDDDQTEDWDDMI